VEQVPERLIPDAIKNTNLKVVHRMVSKDDREVIAGCMNLTSSQSTMISRLRPGQAVISGDGDDSPCMVQVET
jgi:DNA helicase HerA-like ATPase